MTARHCSPASPPLEGVLAVSTAVASLRTNAASAVLPTGRGG